MTFPQNPFHIPTEFRWGTAAIAPMLDIAPKYKMVYNVTMRMTVNLDPDVYSFTSAYAGAKGITLSAALSELVRRAEQVPEPGSDSPRLKTSPHGYLVIAGTGDVLTPEMVKEAAEDELV
jgi:hypothetical protein